MTPQVVPTLVPSRGDAGPAIRKLFYTSAETAEALGFSESYTRALIAAGSIPSVKIGKSRRVPIEALEQWVREQSDAREA